MVIDEVPLPVRVLYMVAIALGGIGIALMKFAISIPMLIGGIIAAVIGGAISWVADRIYSRHRK
jgi:hypothetical protein